MKGAWQSKDEAHDRARFDGLACSVRRAGRREVCKSQEALNRGSQAKLTDDRASAPTLSMSLARVLVRLSSISVVAGLRFGVAYAIATRSPRLPEVRRRASS